MGAWIIDWREERLSARQWLLAALFVMLASTAYCLLSGLASGDLATPSLSLAWGGMVVGVFALAGFLLHAWRRVVRERALVRLVGTALILVLGVTLFVTGEKWLAQLYLQRPWSDFGGHFVSRAPLGLLMLAVVGLPTWLNSWSNARLSARDVGSQPPADPLVVLQVTTSRGSRQFSAEEIVRVQAAGNYVELHVGGEYHLLRATMSSLAERLGGSGFVRVHRSAMINCRHVRTISRDGNGEWQVRLGDGSIVRVGRRYRDAIQTLVASRPPSFVTKSRRSPQFS